ncbi:MAG: class I SAM-dependent methyltransferase [Oscillospiraceae bacterium]|nr:class I SAM-dependent methyltransferase [Oscillospiraceae bacterium]
MRYTTDWKDYALLDCADGERLERWGDIVLIRPDPQVIWSGRNHPLWMKAHARYQRSKSGGGAWENLRPMPEQWQIGYGDLRFHIKPMGFKHTGLFPEQATNWNFLRTHVGADAKSARILNLFAYTGGATVACLAAGAHVTHVDASKGMVQRAKENAALSGLSEKPVRWMVDDCIKFVQREIRRGNTYDVILLDPPSYGRGPGGEVWQLGEQLQGFLQACAQLLASDGMLLLNSYSAEFSPGVMEYLLGQTLVLPLGGTVSCEEIGLPVESTGRVLPCGSTAIWQGGDTC